MPHFGLGQALMVVFFIDLVGFSFETLFKGVDSFSERRTEFRKFAISEKQNDYGNNEQVATT